MFPSLRAATVAALFAALPAAAQPAPDCAAVLAALPLSPAEPPTAVAPEGPDGCRFGRMRFALGGPAGYEVASVLLRDFSLSGPPRDLRLEARGITFSLRTGTALDWVTAQQRIPFDVVLDVSHNPAARRLTLREASMSGEALGRVTLSGVLEDLDLAGPVPDLALVQRAGLRSLSARMESRRWIVDYALSGLSSSLPDTDTAAAVEAAKAAAAASAREVLPLTGATPATLDAVTRFIQEFPHPRHPFALDVAVSEGAAPVRAADLMAIVTPADLAGVFGRIRVAATYEGRFPEAPPDAR